jgi:catechol 2,3-dioxygenase-like lactoylglutathione lyase family enzyme
MITTIHSATVAVEDLDKALDFYVNTLGREKGTDAPMGPDYRFLTVGPPGSATQLVLALEHWFPGGPTRGGFTGISFNSPDIDETYKILSERGVKFKEPVSVTPWGDKATWFYEIDGNEFFLDQPVAQ